MASISKSLEALRKALPADRFISPGTDEYTNLNSAYQAAQQSELKPTQIIAATSVEDVSVFLRTIAPFSIAGDAPFAITGGCQQPASACNNIHDGIVLHLNGLKGIELSDGIVKIAAGERWGAVYEKLDGTGLGVAGGRSATCGIGGLALTGGLSFFSSREGFISNNVVNFEVVLASGEVVNANAQHNADLFTALRGGGNNFGIVTRFDFRTFTQGPFFGGSVFYFAPSFPSQLEALVNEIKRPDASPETHLMVSTGFAAMFAPIAGDQPMCQNQVYYTREAKEVPPVLKPFTDIQPNMEQLYSMRPMTLVEAAKEQNGDQPQGTRTSFMNTTVKADIATLQAAADIYTKAFSKLVSLNGIICALTFQPFAKTLLQSSAANGPNVLGLKEDESVVSILLGSYWKDSSDDEIILKTSREVLGDIDVMAAKKGQAVGYKFMNYAGDFQDVVGSYGEENKETLRKVSSKYDPEGLFQKGVPGGWKLFV